MRDTRDPLRALDLIRPPDLRRRIRDEPRGPMIEPRRGRIGVAILAFVVAAGGIGFVIRAFGGQERPTPPASTVENGKIAFSGTRIWVVDPDGSGLTELTGGVATEEDFGPVWSPDGTRLAYSALMDDADAPGADYHVFVMNADGSDPSNLTPTTGGFAPSWSPDGSQLAYDAFQERTDRDIFVVDIETGRVRPVVESPLLDIGPSWSPDGGRIAFERWPVADADTRDSDIYTVSPDGSGLTRLTGPGYDTEPTWSPDGSRLAFVSRRGGVRSIVVVEADGSGEVQVSRSAATEASEPVWSPDGTRIAFQAFEGDGWDVWVANADGTEQMAVTGGPGDELSPVWSPDGARIAFLTSEEPVEDLDLYVVNPDATGLTKLAEGVPAGGGELSWQPVVVTRAVRSPTSVQG